MCRRAPDHQPWRARHPLSSRPSAARRGSRPHPALRRAKHALRGEKLTSSDVASRYSSICRKHLSVGEHCLWLHLTLSPRAQGLLLLTPRQESAFSKLNLPPFPKNWLPLPPPQFRASPSLQGLDLETYPASLPTSCGKVPPPLYICHQRAPRPPCPTSPLPGGPLCVLPKGLPSLPEPFRLQPEPCIHLPVSW